jgi:hypothetical protein
MGTTSGPMHEADQGSQGSQGSRWVTGFAVFGGSMMIVIGIFQIVVGLTAIFEDTFYVLSDNYLFGFGVRAWGWIHLVLGVIVAYYPLWSMLIIATDVAVIWALTRYGRDEALSR